MSSSQWVTSNYPGCYTWYACGCSSL